MTMTRMTTLAAAALMLGSAGAGAADLYGGSMKDGYAPPPMMAAPSPSIYLRVDGAYAAYDKPVITEDGIYDLVDNDIDSHWSVGGGVGLYFGRGFRGDVTLEKRFETDVTGAITDPFATLPGTRHFGFESTVVLANLYYDFDFGHRITPYVGVGLGYAWNKTTAGTVDGLCGCDGTIEGKSDGHVAGALMAGFTARLRGGSSVVGGGSTKDAPVVIDNGRGLYLDVGYRFLYLGDVETGVVRANYNSNNVVSNDPTVSEIHAHEVRVGLRYDLR